MGRSVSLLVRIGISFELAQAVSLGVWPGKGVVVAEE